MTRVAIISSLALIAGAVVFTSTGHAFAPQVRDVTPQNQPTERLIAIGTSSLSGTITAADTGRPIRGANVNVNATIGTPPSSGPLAGNAIGTLGRGRATVNTTSAFVSRQAVTDGSGRFSIERLPAGSYNVSASRQQFLNTNYGQRKPGGQGTLVVVGESQNVNISLALMHGGSISGTVFGDAGDPQPQTQVSAWRIVMNNGVKQVQQNNQVQTDDRGMYRLFGLQPGDYFVAATPFNNDRFNTDRLQADKDAIDRAIASGAVRPPAGPGLPSMAVLPVQTPARGQPFAVQNQPPGYLPTFAPSVSVPSRATPVHVAGGDEHPNVDIQVQLVEASQIVGVVTTPLEDGVGVQVSVFPQESSFDMNNTQSTRVGADGKFTLRNIWPGKYFVFAQTVAAPQRGAVPIQIPVPAGGRPGGPPQLTEAQHMWARASVDVAGQSSIDVSLALKPGKSISGSIAFAYKTEPPPNLSQVHLMVTLVQAPGGQQGFGGAQPQAAIGLDGRFTLTGVVAGKYSVRVNGGLMKSATVNGQDVLDVPLDFNAESDVMGLVITMTDAATQVSGHLTDAAGKPALDYTIILASTDERFWTPGSRRITTARTDSTGEYTLRNMPPGTYMIGAVTDFEFGGQYDPELLKSLRSASRTITVTENEKIVQDLRVGK
jgi:hypothetical protein